MNAADLLEPIKALQARIRDEVVAACEGPQADELARVASSGADEGDTIYAIDRISEGRLVDLVDREIARHVPVLLVAEGLPGGRRVLPDGARADEAPFVLLVDPIDGTRGLMYQKRSAWILTGVAPNRGPQTTLADIEVAVQTEIPLVKQHLGDVLWAVRGRGAHAHRENRFTRARSALALRPSRADSPAHGFSTIARFFPGGRDVLAALDDDLAQAIAGRFTPGEAYCFEDQYICTAGQLYELMVGHDRFVADLRPLLVPMLARRGWPKPHCCHPYDLATALIAEEAGVVVTDATGAPLRCPISIDDDVAWIGYANPRLRARVEPVLQKLLGARGLRAGESP